jgi:GNAT superfamily N-acetyltransferase
MNKILIETGKLDDVEPFVALLEDAAAWLWDSGVHQWRPGSMRAQRPTLEEWTRSGYLVVARSGTGLAAGCALVPYPTPEWEGGGGVSRYVQKLVVARSHAGQGLAHQVLAWCKERTRTEGVALLRLDCWDGNAKLRSLYRESGFRELGAVAKDDFVVRLFEREL